MIIRYATVGVLGLALIMPSVSAAQILDSNTTVKVDTRIDPAKQAELRAQKKAEVRASLDVLKKSRVDFRARFDARADTTTQSERRSERDEIREQNRGSLQNASQEARKRVLLNAIDVQIKHMEQLKIRIENFTRLNADTKAKIIAQADAFIADMITLRSKVEATTDLEEIKQLSVSLRSMVKAQKDLIKEMFTEVKTTLSDRIVVRAEARADAMRAKFAELESAGADLTAARVELDAAVSFVAQARVHMEAGERQEMIADLRSAYKSFIAAAKIANEIDVKIEAEVKTDSSL